MKVGIGYGGPMGYVPYSKTPPVLASWEYKCPRCGHINVRYERMGRIVCSKCGGGFG